MRIGVTVRFQFSYFSGGGGHTALSIAEACANIGHAVSLVNVEGDKDWWDDALPLKDMWKDKLSHVNKVASSGAPFDLLLECDPMLLTVDVRQKVTKRAVWVIRKPVLLHDVEASLFPFEQKGRDLDGVQEVWVMDHCATRDDIQYLEVLTRRPVRVVPWLWTPSAVEAQRRSVQLPVWKQLMELDQFKNNDWSVHICETNFSASSSATIPLVVLREAQLRKSATLQRSVKIHNIDHLKKNDYFHNNVTQHCTVEGLTNEYLGRQRVCDWVMDAKSFLLAHSRFLKIRPYVLEALWCGIPVVHNLPLVRDLGHGCERFYYTDNEIGEGCMAISQMDLDYKEKKGFFAAGAHEAVRAEILRRFTPYSPERLQGWKQQIDTIAATVAPAIVASVRDTLPAFTAPAPVTAHVPVAQTQTLPTPPQAGQAATPVQRFSLGSATTTATPVALPVNKNKQLTVGFCDMWENFQADYNPFLLLLRDAGADVVGIQATGNSTQQLDLLVFGPFGSTWKSVAASVAKIHFTGENSPPVEREDIILNLGFQHRPADPKYMRLPLWMLEINWWNADPDRLVNPKPLPLEAVTRTWDSTLADRKKWCAFVVSNPSNQIRNKAFWWMNEKKEVDSAGRLFNTVGPDLFAGLGGGGGELKKHEFLKSYKYCFAYENNSSPGYTTEKLLHAKAAGCIPLYWGDAQVETDFDPRGFVDMRAVKTKEEFWAKIDEIEKSEDRWQEILRQPALTAAKVEEVRGHLKAVAAKILGTSALPVRAATPTPILLPTPVQQTGQTGQTGQNQQKGSDSDVVAATCFNWRFMSSFDLWLRSIQERGISRAVVYCMDDIGEPSFENFKKLYPWINFYRLPNLQISGFTDWKAPQHYAWKLWCLQDLALNPQLAGSTVLYLDTGVFLCALPKQWIEVTQAKGVSILEDEEQINKHWCHSTFCSRLSVTEEEKQQNQTVGGLQCFVAGNPTAISYFKEAWKWAQEREVIVGGKWEGIGSDGKPYGHRHDQSILSIVSARQGISRLPLRSVYCDKSLRDTYKLGRSIYVHRGQFKPSIPFAHHISEAHVINLARRADRMDRFKENHASWVEDVRRFDAYDGRAIQLTPALARLFRPHDFGWKKAIMGCALSHLELWLSLLSDTAETESYLIMEDDVKFSNSTNWKKEWEAAAAHVPADWDVIYLGGILPPNRGGFETVKEKVNPFFSRIAMNTIFGQKAPSRYFHFCNYSYILSRRGAQKIIDTLKQKGGYWTSADHMICNNHESMNLYFLDPLITGCYQDDDPKYRDSSFNNYNRVDSFDSDLWNNDERFSQEEILKCLQASQNADIQFGNALGDARPSLVSPASLVSPLPITSLHPSEETQRKIYSLNGRTDSDKVYWEREWFQYLFGNSVNVDFQSWDSAKGVPCEMPIILYRTPDIDHTRVTLKEWSNRGVQFILLHTSDEHGRDPIDIYDLPGCKSVIRFYSRGDIPAYLLPKVAVIPLGPHFMESGDKKQLQKKTVWSFYGTAWQQRDALLGPLKQIQPHTFQTFQQWADPAQLKKEEYCTSIRESIFVPCPRGNNTETFRFYEALELGSLPILVEEQKGDGLYRMIRKHLPSLRILGSWAEAPLHVQEMLSNPTVIQEYHRKVYTEWAAWKKELSNFLQSI